MYFDHVLSWEVCVLTLIFFASFVNSHHNGQNNTVIPYPYQTALGLTPGQGLGIPAPQNVGASIPYPYTGINLVPTQIPNVTQNSNLYSMLAQQGRPAYQYPLGYSQPGYGYPEPSFGYPPLGVGYPPPQGFTYQQHYQPLGRFGYTYPGMGTPYYGSFSQPGQGTGQQQYNYGRVADPYANIKTEIIDVSPEYHRQILGWPSGSSFGESKSDNTFDGSVGDINRDGSVYQESGNTQPRYNIKTDSQTSNLTFIPSNLTKPIVTSKTFSTSIRRTFVYDSTKSGQNQTVNLHFVNGEQVTTTASLTTTENEDVKGIRVTPKGRRFMDVPASCPKGTFQAHNGQCLPPFTFVNLGISKNNTAANTTSVTTIAPE